MTVTTTTTLKWRQFRIPSTYINFHQMCQKDRRLLRQGHLNLFRNSIHSDSIHSLELSLKASCSRLELNPNQFTSLKLTILNILPKYIFTHKLTQFMNKFIETTVILIFLLLLVSRQINRQDKKPYEGTNTFYNTPCTNMRDYCN